MRLLEVKVQTGARDNSVTAMPDGSFKVRTTAVPEKGKANTEVIKLLAEHLGISKTNLSIAGGATSSRKKIRVD